MLVFAFQSEIWIAQNFTFTVFEDFCLSLSWKYRFLQNVNHAKVQSKTNKYCKFHVDLTKRRLSKSRFKKLGMVPKKLYQNMLKTVLSTLFSNKGEILPWKSVKPCKNRKNSREYYARTRDKSGSNPAPPPSQGTMHSQMPGICPGWNLLKLQFDRYINGL